MFFDNILEIVFLEFLQMRFESTLMNFLLTEFLVCLVICSAASVKISVISQRKVKKKLYLLTAFRISLMALKLLPTFFKLVPSIFRID